MNSVNVRPAKDCDIEEIFNWRNDKTTRVMSHSMNKVEWSSHLEWYETSLKNPNKCFLICYFSKTMEKIGFVSFSIEDSVAITSINLAPKMRGQGLSKRCLNTSISFFKKKFIKIKKLEAEIKSKNTYSRRAFEEAGFVLNLTKNDVGYFTLYI